MIAIILAAGMGRRLKAHTVSHTKCMLKVAGKRLIDRTLDELISLNLEKIIIVVGYKAENLISHVNRRYHNENIEFVNNAHYDTTNNIHSLSLVSSELKNNDVLLMESDVVLESGILSQILDDPFPNLSLVAKYEPWMSGTMVELDDKQNIKNVIRKENFESNNCQEYYKTVNIHKFSKEFLKNRYLPFLNAYIEAFGRNQFYEEVLNIISFVDKTGLRCHLLNEEKWYEIDDEHDLHIAEILFSENDTLQNYYQEYGGYWRFPKLLDFCYLTNPYFPTAALKKEFNAVSNELLTSYPSGRKINDRLAANLFNIDKDYICIANGASEIIKEITKIFSNGKIGIMFPTFEEYPNSIGSERIVSFICPFDSDISSSDIINYFENKGLSILLLINPDIPTGRFIKKTEVIEIIIWANRANIFIIIDESFIDFSDDFPENTMLNNNYLKQYSNLIIIKSMSKTYGVPGVRLGILATANIEIIEKMKNLMPIWNINSYGQYFMQIIGKYESEYLRSCVLLRTERSRFFKNLANIEYLKAFPSQGNFFLCEVLPPYNATELAEYLLKEFNILIKDCSQKQAMWHSNFIRIGINDPSANDKLIMVLKQLSIKTRNQLPLNKITKL